MRGAWLSSHVSFNPSPTRQTEETVEIFPATKYVHAPKKIAASENGTTFCGVLEPDLPSFCGCVDAPYGGTLNCTVAITAGGVTLDTVVVVLDLQPCALPMYFSFEVTEAAAGVDYKYEITAGEEEMVPVPYLSVAIPGLGEAGVFMIVDIDGNIDALTIDIGVDACVDTFGLLTCASTVDPVDFPIWLLEATYDFGDVCATAMLA